jgi:transcriptional regulator with XRE-family HTH domain
MVKCGYDTFEQLSDASGINRNTLSDIFKGTAYPSGMTMQKLAKALDLEPEEAGRIFFVPRLVSNSSYE